MGLEIPAVGMKATSFGSKAVVGNDIIECKDLDTTLFCYFSIQYST